MRQMLQTLIPVLLISAATGCSHVKQVQADLIDAELVKIDTVFRYPKEEILLTFKCRNKMEFVSYVPLQLKYQVGSVYKVLLPK